MNPSNNLGIRGKSTNRQENQQLTGVFAPNGAKFQKYDLMREAGALLYSGDKAAHEQHRTCWCHRGIPNAGGSVAIYRQSSGDSARMHGVTTCKSVWACPVCSAKVCAARQTELAEAMKNWIDQGGYVWLLTMTFPHEYMDRLAELLPKFTKAKEHFKNSNTYKRIFAKDVRKGSVTSLEVTHGENGWHPHQHDLVFATPDVFGRVIDLDNGRKTSGVIDELKAQWYVSLVRAGLCCEIQKSDVLAHGLDVRGGQYAAEYIAKFGKEQKWGLSREVSSHAAKVGTDNKGAHPFQLLAWSMAGDATAGQLFREYAEAFDGKRMLSWSRGLKKELTGTKEMTDDEALAKELPEELRVGRIDGEALAIIQSRRLLANFLAFVAAYCSDEATAQEEIDAYVAWAAEQPRRGRGLIKQKMHYRGFMHVDAELMNV